ncbi:dimethylarginine dimethylaminohydrolase family protein [Flavobacterium sp. CS20]|uniref:dimethylarginine dimethylaminohydrolase family protein n=1 Tax=Flavobacterium sp. CS20 TaxID=2775246 RepID=UPI001B3A6F46|nr:arginine deiminase family protein [Flavobacterium sp. CS20]QTY27194.1 amidinotransferase [Flavobacterium sp. CS20]
MKLNIQDETSRLRQVILGRADSNGSVPKLEEAYDPKSIEHIKKGTYPKEKDMIKEMDEVLEVFKKYDVKVYRPELLKDCNQIFSRDIAFVIEDKFIKSNILPDREKEIEAIQYILDQIPQQQIIKLPDEAHIEGGDVMPHHEYIFIGTYRGSDYPNYITARTNPQAVEAIQKIFPHKKVKSFNLRKSNTDAYNNALHLDCRFQPIGEKYAILHKNGFLEETEYQWLVDFFGKDNIFEITAEEMYDMNSNIFSIDKDIVISDRSFTRLNQWMRHKNITVEEVHYREIAKQEGLLRCSTLPLQRD